MIIAGGALFMVAGRWGHGATDAIREGTFNAVSILTTTGFVNADFAGWSSALQIAIVGFMFIGGMAGSTAGGVKTYRLAVLTSAGRTDLRRLIHPLGVFRPRIGSKPLDDAVVNSVQTFFLFYMLAFMTGTLLLAMVESGLGVGDDLVTSVSAVASAMGNIGPGLAAVGPSETYAHLPDTGKWLLSSLMIIGRLEIFPVILLFTRELWRR
jgi:trk system potassium uptake protein TrkH